MTNDRTNKNNKVSVDTVITDVDQEGPALTDIVAQHRAYLSPSKSLKYIKEAQAYLNTQYAENNAQTDREKMSVIQSLRLETPLKIEYATDLMQKEPNIAIEIYEVAFIQHKAAELANTPEK